jgi:hypothetical protein
MAEERGSTMFPTRRTVLAGAAAVALPSFRAPAWAAPSLLSPGAQREDLDVVRRVLGESHVGLHWWLDRRTYAAMLEALVDQAAAPVEPRLFQLRLTRFVAALRHGHTTVERTVAGSGYRLRRVPNGSAAFPLGVRVIDGRLHVAHDLSADGDVGAGAELLEINGRPARALLADMEALISADGPGTSFKRHQLGPGWRFPDVLELLSGPRDRHRVRVRRLDGRAVAMALSAATPEELVGRFAERRGRALDAYGPAVAYERRDRVGVLAVGSFYEGLLPKGSPGYAAEFDRAFARVAADGLERLVLDLRSNEGGNNDYVPMLYAHIADRPFRFIGPTILSSNTISGLRYAEDPSEDLKAFAVDPSKFVRPDPRHGWVLRPQYALIRDYAPRSKPYAGPLTVLTDGGSFSATGGVLDLIHRFHRREGREVRFLGEAPGHQHAVGLGQRRPKPECGPAEQSPPAGRADPGLANHFGSAPVPVSLPDRILEPTPAELASGVDGVLARATA